MCDCHDSTAIDDPTQVSVNDPLYTDISVDLGMDDAREFAPSNWITGIRPPVFRNALGGPAESPAPAGMNQRIMPIIEAKSFDLTPWADIQTPEDQAASPVYEDNSDLFLDTGYIGGNTQELG